MRIKKGFSLLEILLVITIIGVLSGALILVIDPAEQFANARNQQREIDLQTILVATEQYIEDNQGALPPGIDTTSKTVCRSGCVTDASQVNLQVLIPYIGTGALPVDPDETDSALTGYTIRTSSDGRLNLNAPRAENGETVSLGSSADTVGFDPTRIPGFVMWFSTDEGIQVENGNRVAQWTDKSGAHTFSQTNNQFRPELITDGETNFQAIAFDGTDDFMDGVTYDFNGQNAISLVIVSALTSEDDDRDPSDEFEHAYAPFFFSETGAFGELHINPQRLEVAWRFGSGTGAIFPLPNHTRTQDIGGAYSSTIAVKDSATETLYVNGAQVAQATGKDFPTANIATAAQLGRENYNTPSYFRGNVVEIMAFESALLETDILNMQAYFSGRYGTF